MRFGFYAPNFAATGDPARVVELAVRAEAAGWDGFFLWDHLSVQPPPVADPWVTLGAVAARTERIVLGPLIVPLARRRPQKVALEAATLARLAPERFVLGVGLGVPRDFTLFGEDDDWRVRAEKVSEGLALMRRLWAGEELGTDDEPLRYLEHPLDVRVWASGIWPRRLPVHGIENVDGVFPTVKDADGRFTPPSLELLRSIVDSVPERARADVAIWGWRDSGEVETEAYEEAGATWWMVETFGLGADELFALADRGPGRLAGAA